MLDSSLGYAALFADFDHEGDLDLFLATTARNRLYRNNLDGTFTELSKKMGIAGGNVLSRDAIFGDFDEDGDLDLFVVNEDTSNQLYTNLRQGRFLEITETSGLTSDGNSGSATAGDYNNDGFLDLFVTALSNGSNYLYRNNGNGTFEKDVKQIELYQALDNIIGLDVCFFDFDNDGFLDLLVVGEQDEKRENGSGVRLFHNDGTGSFKDVSTILPPDLTSGYRIAVADYNEDGDMDIFSASISDHSIAWYENDGATDPTWVASDIATSATGARGVFAADMDNDGDMDILSASEDDDTIAWYETSAIPEFSNILMPIVSVLAIVGFNYRRRLNRM